MTTPVTQQSTTNSTPNPPTGSSQPTAPVNQQAADKFTAATHQQVATGPQSNTDQSEASQTLSSGAAANDEPPVTDQASTQRDPVTPPEVSGKKLGEWGETFTSKTLTGGEQIKAANRRDGSFDTVGQAAAHAGTQVANKGAGGAVVVEKDGRYFAYEMKTDAWFSDFNRANLEGGFDTLKTDKGEVDNIRAFVTTDGYMAQPTVSRSNVESVPVHIVEKGRAGGYWHSTKLPGTEAYKDIVAARQAGNGPQLNERSSVQLFQNMVKASAIEQLDNNQRSLDVSQKNLETALKDGDDRPFDALRETIVSDQALAAEQKKLGRESNGILLQMHGLSQSGVMLTKNGQDLMTDLTQRSSAITTRQADLLQARQLLRQDNPALAVLNTEKLNLDKTDNAGLMAEVRSGFDEARGHIDTARTKIHNGDMPLEELGPIVNRVKADLNVSAGNAANGDKFSQSVENWLDDEKFKENVITWGGTAVSLGLGIGAMFASGGTAVLLGLGGAAAGFGTAGYEFERADDLNSAARSGDGTNRHIIDDPEGAKFNYVMGAANLVLAGLDLSLAARAASTLSKAARLAGDVPGLTSAMAGKLKPAQMDVVKDAYTLAAAGDDEAARALLGTVKNDLDPATAKAVEDAIAGAKPPTSSAAAVNATEELLRKAERFTVDPDLAATDVAKRVLVDGSYVQNPTARNLAESVNEFNKVRVDGKLANGHYMYTIDEAGTIKFGTRGKDPLTGETLHMPHPTLVGGKDPTVLAAGMVEFRGGKIHQVDNVSGHFKPAANSLEVAQHLFERALPERVFSKDFAGFVPYSE